MNQTELFHTTNLKAATALLTLGFRKLTISKIIRDDGRESIVFWFEPRNADGLKASDVFHGMTKGGDALAASDPENVINYLRVFANNRDELLTDIKQTPRFVSIKKNGKQIAISEKASEEDRKMIASIL